MKYIVLLWLLILSLSSFARDPSVPRAAYQYKALVLRMAYFEDGRDATVAAYAAQIQTESDWKNTAHSKYANGLTEFTPDTEKWIEKQFSDLGTAGSTDPAWSIQGMIKYDGWLRKRVKGETFCDVYKKSTAAYNGGLGGVYSDEKLTVQKGGNPLIWDNNVALYSHKAPEFFKENRGYPIKIVYTYQPAYLTDGWGTQGVCIK